ncbi:MAG: EAL domain-containing protein [Psychromonas sp.]
MFESFALQIIIYSIFPFYLAHLKKPIRKSAFYTYISMVLFVGGFFGSILSVPITDTINISAGNIAYGALMMTSILFVIIERDIFIIKGIVRLVITVNIFKILIFYAVAWSLGQAEIINPNNTSASVFNVSVWSTILGGSLIISELIFLLYLFEKFKEFIKNSFLLSIAYILSFIVVLCLDGVLFPSLAFGFSDKLLDFVVGGVQGKLIMASAYSIPLAIFLYIYRDNLAEYAVDPPFAWKNLFISSANLMRNMKANEERIKQATIVFNNTREGIVLTDTNFTIISINNAFIKLTGITEKQVLNDSYDLGTLITFIHESYELVRETLFKKDYWQGEIVYHNKSGAQFSALLSINSAKNNQGETTSYVGVLTDITEIKHAQEELIYLANHDWLTKLPNRRCLIESLNLSLIRAKRSQDKLALLIFDLDHFKDINDSYGHLSGDELLKEISNKLRARTRETDLLCRIGGDEFALLLINPDSPVEAGVIASELITVISGAWKLVNGLNVHVGATVGISFYPDHGNTSDLLLQQADSALYHAKKTERGTFQYFTDSMTVSARCRIEQEYQLRNCIKEGHLEVFYQPQVNIKTGEIYGAEALVRWNDPIKGYIQPNDFIPLAEATGLIGRIGEDVLRKTCLKGMEWINAGLKPLILSVNLSAHQLHHGDIVSTVKFILNETGFPAKYLELELTESALMEREDQILPALESLRSMGIRLAIDDFGTGYSSLAYLKFFPINTLKIDKSFIDGIPNSTDSTVLTSTIISMSKNLGYSVIAEGVETIEQLEWLKTMDCDSFQGYLKSKPLPADEFFKLYARVGNSG